MNITINIIEPIKRVQEFREYDLGQITTTLQDLLDNSSITIESNIIPILKVLSVDNIIKNYLIKDLTENLYNTQDYITGQDLTEDDLILFVSESQILDLQNKLEDALIIQQSTGIQNGYLSSTDWNTFNNKQPALGFTPENEANKTDSYTTSSSTAYVSGKALVDGLGGKATLISISQIRALSGVLSNNYFYTIDLGKAGNWYYDASDTTSADNTGTILVTTDGKRIKRFISDSINLKWFGATGDGITDDYVEVQKAITFSCDNKYSLYVPAGSYLINSSFISVTKAIHIYGEGCSSTTSRGVSRFITTNTTGDLFNFTNSGGKISLERLSFENISVTTPTSGSVGLNFQNADCTEINQVSVINFYNNVFIQSGVYYNFNGLYCFDPVNIGVLIRNIINSDIGDMSFAESYFIINFFTNRIPIGSAIKWESGGGLRVTNCKINYSGNAKWKIGIDINPTTTQSTSVFIINGNSFENCTDKGIYFHNDNINTTIGKVIISNNEFMVGTFAIKIFGTNTSGIVDSSRFKGFVITGNKIDGQYGVVCDGAVSINTFGNEFNVSHGTVLYGTSCYYCAQNNNILNPLAYDVIIYQNGQTETTVNYSTDELKFDRNIPAGVTTSIAVKLFGISLLQNYRNCKITFDIDAMADGLGATYLTQTRIFSSNGGTSTIQTVGTDLATTANIVDVLYTISGKTVSVTIKLNAAATSATLLHGKVTCRIDGRVYSIKQY